ncbi:AraC family transcriptional regulator [Salipaludibacillus agaradhaerens]|uniref:AraC family transcriptional regulator n=1 Tax=Salipaludibacillus agaradhaerens TaxID=76935 RepID=A0A9Q4B3A0_SALAG|nr:AraC family transcriptional regulator [Salipaludibacillus agaradhaerens]MCR6097165.1 AraC family transcriptional regulator [Salipaludibacillus agaradhaerens]MCR6113350.1 AraC family transcriptional regulator [Salipaludibacillus agaradhaerens]
MDMLKGMNEALNYIEENLANKIDLNEVANRAFCSEYHFKRLFSLLSGITISEYIRRRRLTLSALELKDAQTKVIDVALKYGYQSPDAFSRAFQNFHGVTPSLSRSSDQNLKAYPRMAFQLTIQGGTEMNYRIVEKEAFKIVGVKNNVNMINEILSPTYEEMMAEINDTKMRELASMLNMAPYGMVHASANYSEDEEGNATFNQYIGVASTKEEINDYTTLEVPASTWAIFEIDGDWPHIENHWQRIYSEWLPTSSYELTEGPELLVSDEHKSGIWISIKKK